MLDRIQGCMGRLRLALRLVRPEYTVNPKTRADLMLVWS